MARKTLSHLFVANTTLDTSEKRYIPSITEFCYGQQYLNLSARGITLYPVQHLMLRAFYRGSPGNTSKECMEMTPEEIELCKKEQLNGNKNGNIIDKWNSGEIFRELVLVWGRRSGKDFSIAIIALYEAMRLMESPGGDPYKVYNLDTSSPFNILTIANNKEQARILFREMHGKLIASPYFQHKFLPEGILSEKIHLLTPKNIEDNKTLKAKGLSPFLGSIVIEAGHSNSSGLVGKGCFVLCLDECGLYKKTGGPGSDEALYGALSPTVITYVREEEIKDKNGKVIEVKKHYDGKIISISSPREMDGVFYNLYSTADRVSHRLMCRLPTWTVNPKYTQERLRIEDPSMTPDKFRMEYGAEFSGTAGSNFFVAEKVDDCFLGHGQVFKDKGQPGVTYFANLDPASSSHNYVLAIVHRHQFMNRVTREVDFHIILDHMKVWSPTDGNPIRTKEIDDYMIEMHKRFHLGLVTYDRWNSAHSIDALRRAGIPAKETHYGKYYKMQIYDNMQSLVNDGKLKLPWHQLLHDEMIHLQRAYKGSSGFSIYPKRDGEVRTDDAIDALAGACFQATIVQYNQLPKIQTVNLPIVSSGGQSMFQSSSGHNYTWQELRVLDRITKR